MLTVALAAAAAAMILFAVGMWIGVYLERGHTVDLQAELAEAEAEAQRLDDQMARLRAQLEAARQAHLTDARPANVHHALYAPSPAPPGEALHRPRHRVDSFVDTAQLDMTAVLDPPHGGA